MNPFLKLLYYFLRFTIRNLFDLYHGGTLVINRKNLFTRAPLIVVSNHPNTLLDPLHVACRMDELCFFLANYSLFKNPVSGWILNKLYCIPIQRPQDVGGMKVDNKEAFARCDEFLSGKGCLYIAPEGSSFMERHLREVKTGTARIALSAEAGNQFQLGLRILPIGLTYSKPDRFQGKLVMEVGEPIQVADFAGTYEKDYAGTVRKLTAHITDQIASLIVNTKNENEEKMLERVEGIVRTEEPLSLEQDYRRSKQLLELFHTSAAAQPERMAAFRKQVQQYYRQLRVLRTDDATLLRVVRDASFGKTVLGSFILILGFPVFLYGLINNLLACIIPLVLIRLTKPYIGYYSAFKTAVGLITGPLFYGLQSGWVASYFGEGARWLYLLSLIPAGLLAWHYWGFGKRWFRTIQLSGRLARVKGSTKKLMEKRDAILSFLTESGLVLGTK